MPMPSSIFGLVRLCVEPCWCWPASPLRSCSPASRTCIPHGRSRLPPLAALWGTYETTRCLRLRWSFYHGGVLLLLYMDVTALTMIFFLLLYPYAEWIQ